MSFPCQAAFYGGNFQQPAAALFTATEEDLQKQLHCSRLETERTETGRRCLLAETIRGAGGGIGRGPSAHRDAGALREVIDAMRHAAEQQALEVAAAAAADDDDVDSVFIRIVENLLRGIAADDNGFDIGAACLRGHFAGRGEQFGGRLVEILLAGFDGYRGGAEGKGVAARRLVYHVQHGQFAVSSAFFEWVEPSMGASIFMGRLLPGCSFSCLSRRNQRIGDPGHDTQSVT